jgi:multicomponent Na+:H+ antiporter subunit D
MQVDMVILNWLLGLFFCAALCAELFPRFTVHVRSEREKAALARGPLALGALSSVMGLGLAASLLSGVSEGGPTRADYRWTSDLYQLRFQADVLSTVIVIAICLLGLVVYLHLGGLPGLDRVHRRAALMLAVQGAGIAAVLSLDVIALIFFLELMLVALWLLASLDAPRQADWLLTMGHGGTLIVVAGALLMWNEAADSSLRELPWLLLSASPATLRAVSVLLLLGLLPRLACVPGHGWAPALAEGHAAATAVPAVLLPLVGGSVLLRLLQGTLVLPTVPSIAAICLTLGFAALWWGAVRAWLSRGLRQLAAWLMVAQSGYVLIALSLAASPTATDLPARAAALQVLLGPTALVAVWCAASSVAARAGTDALAGLSGLSRKMPLEGLALLAGGLSIAGVPPAAGFSVQRLLVSGALADGRPGVASALVLADALVLGAVLSAVRRAFLRREPPPAACSLSPASAVGLLVPALGLALCGLWSGPLLGWSGAVVRSVLTISPGP